MPSALLAVLLAATPVLHVQAGAALGGDGSVERPFARVSEALARAPEGAQLELEPGLYEEPLTIERAAAIVGHGKVVLAGGVVARARARLAQLELQGGRIGLQALAEVRLEGVRIVGQAEAGLECGSGARCALVRTRLESTIASALGMRGSGAIEVDDVTLAGPFRRAIELDGGSLSGRNLTIGGGVTGLHLLGARVSLRDARFDGLRGSCVFAHGGELELRDAVFTGCEVAVEVRMGTRAHLEGAELSRCTRAAVTSDQSSLELRDVVIQGPSHDGAIIAMGGDAKLVDVLVRNPGPHAVLTRLGKLELQRVTVLGARHDPDGDFGNALFAFDTRLSGQGLLARACEGPAIEAQLGGGRLADVEVEQGGDAALALEHSAQLDVDGLLARGGTGVGVACTERSGSRLRAPSIGGYANGSYLVDCSCRVELSPKDPAFLGCSTR